MAKLTLPPQVIENWFLMGGRIFGFCNQKDIITSRIVDLRGNIVTTKSGSRYHLSEKTDKPGEWQKLEKQFAK